MKKLFILAVMVIVSSSAFAQLGTSFSKKQSDARYLLKSDTITALSVLAPLNITLNDQSDDYTLVLTDVYKLVRINAATAKNLTVPLNSSVAFPIGTQISIEQLGSGQITIVATGGVTINSAGGALKLRVQYSCATLIKTGTDAWLLTGDITT